MAKEEPIFELPAAKAARIQTAKFDFLGASRCLRAALARSKLLSDPSSPSSEDSTLVEIAAACGATDEELASIKVVTDNRSLLSAAIERCPTYDVKNFSNE
jgi:hypothetical protein